MKVLLCDVDTNFSKMVMKLSTEHHFHFEKVDIGRECQRKLLKDQHDVLIIDLDTKSHTALEVIKSIRLNHLKTHVILTFNNEEIFQSMELDSEKVRKLGVNTVMVKPITPEEIVQSLNIQPDDVDFRQVYESTQDFLVDEEMSSLLALPPSPRLELNMDYFVKLGVNQFEKVLHNGRISTEDQIRAALIKGGGQIFIRNQDRLRLIHFINNLLEKTIPTDSPIEDKLLALRVGVSEVLKEAFIHGLTPKITEEMRRGCQNMINLFERDPRLKDALKDYLEPGGMTSLSKYFLVAIFSTMIAKNIEWQSPRTTEFAALGGLLHDIGISKLPSDLRFKHLKQMDIHESKIFETHTHLGAELSRKADLPEPIAQIILQHQEFVNGEGYPNKLSGSRIYPLAKIISLADGFTSFVIESSLTPKEALKKFLTDRKVVERYDANAIKALIKGFLKEKKDGQG